MKKLILVLTALFTMTVSANAMSYEQARNEALFLTDKMAYELNLTDDQYEAAYEVNLDYLMSIGGYDDVYSTYWTRRNTDLSYILFNWQYNMFCNAVYFYRPLYWGDGFWHFRIYSRYPTRSYFYFGRPSFYASYRGGHSWRGNGGRSYYNGRTFGHSSSGMRDHFDRGDRGGNSNGNFGNRGGNFDGRNGHESSTRTTVTNGNNRNNSNFGGNRGSFNGSDRNNSSFGGSRNSDSGSSKSSESAPTSRSFSTPNRSNSSSGFNGGSSNFSGNRSSNSSSSFGGSRSSGGSNSGSNKSSGGGSSSFGSGSHFGGGRR